MAEAGSFAEKVKQQADIVRVIGEYVPLKKAGQNFRGLCPFHAEKTPSFNVHPTKQIYHCFGCGQGGDVFKFEMEVEKCAFPEAIRIVAEKCGIAVPRPKERSPEERRENQLRAVLVEGYMDAIAVARAGISNVVASCGTALAESQIKLLARFTKRVIVNYDPDMAGQAATERSLVALLEQG